MVINGWQVRYSKLFGPNCVIKCPYVDNMLIFGKNLELVNEIKPFLSFQFDIKDLGVADAILGIKMRKLKPVSL